MYICQIVSEGLGGENTTLLSLNISNNELGDEGATHLAEAPRKNIGLKTLNISRNKIGTEPLVLNMPHSLKEICHALRNNTTAPSLVLCEPALHGLRLLAETNDTKTALDDEGAHLLALALRDNTSLQSLVISHHQIGDRGAKHLAEALLVNKTLQSLDISNNLFTVKGAKRLAEALRVNETLKRLDVSHNLGVDVLLEGLMGNNTLQSLRASVARPMMTVGSMISLGEFLGRPNSSLQSLDVSGSLGDVRPLFEAQKVFVR